VQKLNMKVSSKLLKGNQLSLSLFIVSGRRRRREIHVKNPTFMEGVPGVTPITAQPKLQNIQRKVQDFCGWRRYLIFFFNIYQLLPEGIYTYIYCVGPVRQFFIAIFTIWCHYLQSVKCNTVDNLDTCNISSYLRYL
jgi:hypothetical protein